MAEQKEKTTYLVWEDLTVEVTASARKLLNGLSGLALPNRIMAIIGPSGSGKSTLLDALAGRLSPNVKMTGNVWMNGKHRVTDCSNVSYVTQEDFLLGTLTVRETLTYSAQLRLPKTMRCQEINAIVENTILQMGLQDCAENKIGNWHLRGISGGEKRRLSIGLEILMQPPVMFLDEPTTGLDSAAAFFVMEVLKGISLDGRIVICSIHQPSSYIFDQLDDLCLLSSGEAIYFGEAKLAIKFFEEAGFPCPNTRNPPDHFLRCINSDFDKIASIMVLRGNLEPLDSQINLATEEIKAILKEKYSSSEYLVNTTQKIQEMLVNEEKCEFKTGSNENNNISHWKQMSTLTRRSSINMTRDLSYYWIRILFSALVSVGAGIMFFDIGLSNSAILARTKCYTFVYSFLLCLSVGGLPSIIEEWKVVNHERLNGHYGEVVFVLSNFLSSLVFLIISAVSSGTLVYYMVKLHGGFSNYEYFCINIFCCLSIMEAVTMVVALLVPTFLMGIGVSAAVIMVLTVASGLYMPLPQLPKFFWRYPMTYISFTSWAIEGQYKNDLVGLEFDSMVPGKPKVKGEEVLRKFYGIQLKCSKWWNLAVLFILLFLHRLLFFAVLKYKDRALMLLGRQLHRAFPVRRPSFVFERKPSRRN